MDISEIVGNLLWGSTTDPQREEQDTFAPPIDSAEDNEFYYARVNLAGVNPDDVRLELKNGVLLVTGTRKNQLEGKSNLKTYHHHVRYGAFLKKIELPKGAPIIEEKITAEFFHGLLTIRVPKGQTEAKNTGPQIAIRTID